MIHPTGIVRQVSSTQFGKETIKQSVTRSIVKVSTAWFRRGAVKQQVTGSVTQVSATQLRRYSAKQWVLERGVHHSSGEKLSDRVRQMSVTGEMKNDYCHVYFLFIIFHTMHLYCVWKLTVSNKNQSSTEYRLVWSAFPGNYPCL